MTEPCDLGANCRWLRNLCVSVSLTPCLFDHVFYFVYYPLSLSSSHLLYVCSCSHILLLSFIFTPTLILSPIFSLLLFICSFRFSGSVYPLYLPFPFSFNIFSLFASPSRPTLNTFFLPESPTPSHSS